MESITFEVLAALPILAQYEEAFRKATGVSVTLLPPNEIEQRVRYRQIENAFCAYVGSTPAGCEACKETQKRLQQNAAKELVTQQVYCFAGLTDIAIPVMVESRHVATLLSGQIFRRTPTPQDFEKVVKRLGAESDAKWQKKARKAFFETPVVSADNIQAAIQLLSVFARHLPSEADRHLKLAGADVEPSAVCIAKKFLETHSHEQVSLEQVLQHVHVSRFHFCKIFKKTTGLTFTEYAARLRVAKAKTLLLDHSLRVSEIVFAAGFGSIPQFNSIFKRHVGLSPTEYRAQLRDELLADKS